MDDLAAMITQFLGSEEGMNQLRAVASALGVSDSNQTQPGASAGQPEQSGSGPAVAPKAASEQPSYGTSPPPIDMKTMLLLQQALSAYGKSDRNTELLRALKPHFSPERAKKVDDALRFLQLVRLLPLIKESGLFGSKGGDGT
jgi:hypothetical protein